jgi:hypothetical protein
VEGEVDLVWVLDGLVHGLRLPPRLVLVVVEVCEVGRRVCLRSRAVAHLTRLLGAGRTRLHTELCRTLFAASVSGLYEDIEGRVLEPRNTSLRTQDTLMKLQGPHAVAVTFHLFVVYLTARSYSAER